MLIASGRIDAAAGIYERYDASYWEEGDSRALQNLVDTARRQSMPPRRVDTRLLLEWPPLDPPPLIASKGLGPSTGIALGGTLGLTLRLTGEAGWDVPPAADAVFAVPDYAGAPRPQSDSPGAGRRAPRTRLRQKPRLHRSRAFRILMPLGPRSWPSPAPPTPTSPRRPRVLRLPCSFRPQTPQRRPPRQRRRRHRRPESDAAPGPKPPFTGVAPILMNGVREPDSAWFERATVAAADFNVDTLSDASFDHPVLLPNPTRLTRRATPAASQSTTEGHAPSRPAPSSSSRSSAPPDGWWEPGAALSQRLIFGAADFGHASLSHATFLQSIFLLDLTMLQSGTTATASKFARAEPVRHPW